VNWQPFSIRFRQVFARGYRYLDKCGEFMLAAEDEFEFMPNELKATGAQLAIPERGIRASVDAFALELVQETPVEEDFFASLSAGVASLVQEHFSPVVETRMFEVKFCLPMSTEADAENAMLRFRNEAPSKKLEDEFDMPLLTRKIEFSFESGSQRLNLLIQPIAFEAIRQNRHNPVLQATDSQATRAERLTAQTNRMPQFAPYAVFLEMALTEEKPPLSGDEDLLNVLIQKANKAKKYYQFK